MASIKSGMVLKNSSALSDAIKSLNNRLRVKQADAIKMLGHIIIETAQTVTPVDTGDLRASAYVDEVKVSDSGRYTTVEIGYGGNGYARTPDYALIQHENTDYYHKIGQDHYLSDAIARHESSGLDVLRKKIQEAIDASAFG